MARHSEFSVQGRGFLSFGAQAHNSSVYVDEDLEHAFLASRKLGCNTLAVPMPWELVEPEEGRFDLSRLRYVVDRGRYWGQRLVILWFATWKNGTMEYVPGWVKRDPDRFPRTRYKDGTTAAVLSCHGTATRDAEARAFEALMTELGRYDGDEQTVIAVQVENEPGIYAPTRRDFGPVGERDFASDVPETLVDLVCAEPGSTLARAWTGATAGDWTTVFGDFGAEACTAWHTARHVNHVAEAGKAVYDITLTVNAWIDEGSWGIGGLDYPAGGPASHTGALDIWRAACPAIDVIAPDAYNIESSSYLDAVAAYDRASDGWPLFVSESLPSAPNATYMFSAVGDHGAVGYHVFGVEDVLDEAGEVRADARPMERSMRMLVAASDLIRRYRGSGRMHTIAQRLGARSQHLNLDGWLCRVSFVGPEFEWNAMDYRHREAIASECAVRSDLFAETGRGLLFQAGPDEFYVVGHQIRLLFQRPLPPDGSVPVTLLNPTHQASSTGAILVEEGRFVDGEFVCIRRRTGDEARHGVWMQADCEVVHVILAD
jgi:hypothetical protein